MKLEDGSTYSGEVRNHKPHGYGTLTESDGGISNYTGTFVDGLNFFCAGLFNLELYLKMRGL